MKMHHDGIAPATLYEQKLNREAALKVLATAKDQKRPVKRLSAKESLLAKEVSTLKDKKEKVKLTEITKL